MISRPRSFLDKPLLRIAQHLAFWVLSFFVFLHLFKTGGTVEKVDYIYTGLFHLTLLPAVYLNIEWLLPKYAKRSTWLLYVVLLAADIGIFSWLNYQFFQNWSSKWIPDYFFISYFTLAEITLFFIIYIGLTSLIKLSKSWFAVNELEHRLLQTEKEKVQIELMALRSQVNPHFFFNTLNSIYSMTLDKDDRLPNTVLQLSELMRYFLYESKETFVPLDKEIAVLQDYISLQKLRSRQTLDTSVTIAGDLDGQQIAPLLLITFVENAFKHGAKGNTGSTFVHLAMKVEGNELNFTLENNLGAADKTIKEEHAGVGLQNVKRRLELLYPGNYRLQAGETAGKFVVQLHLKMQHHV